MVYINKNSDLNLLIGSNWSPARDFYILTSLRELVCKEIIFGISNTD